MNRNTDAVGLSCGNCEEGSDEGNDFELHDEWGGLMILNFVKYVGVLYGSDRSINNAHGATLEFQMQYHFILSLNWATLWQVAFMQNTEWLSVWLMRT